MRYLRKYKGIIHGLFFYEIGLYVIFMVAIKAVEKIYELFSFWGKMREFSFFWGENLRMFSTEKHS
jgi:hypothetical protein